jgi:hypothetical protein
VTVMAGRALERGGRPAVPWRALGAGAGVLGSEGVAGFLHPAVGEALAVADVVVPLVLGLVLIIVILAGSDQACERAFRLLRWAANRPEPAAPAAPRAARDLDRATPEPETGMNRGRSHEIDVAGDLAFPGRAQANAGGPMTLTCHCLPPPRVGCPGLPGLAGRLSGLPGPDMTMAPGANRGAMHLTPSARPQVRANEP